MEDKTAIKKAKRISVLLMSNLICLLIMQMLAGCNKSAYIIENTLDKAEELMSEHPDSALHILSAINAEAITGDDLMAYYALLLTKAQYKNYINCNNDSLINIAVNHYKNEGDNKKHAESLMLLGTIQVSAKQYDEAMLSLLYAAELAEKEGDDFLLGQIYSNLYYLCQYGYNADQVSFAEKALYHYEKTGNEYYIIDAKANLGIALYRVRDFDRCKPLFESVCHQALAESDTFSVLKSLPYLAMNYVKEKNVVMADSLYHMLAKDFRYRFKPDDYCTLASLKLANGDRDSAMAIMNASENLRMTTLQRLGYCISAGWVYANFGDYQKAWKNACEYIHMQDSLNTVRYKSTVFVSQRDYIAQKAENQKIIEDRNKIIWATSSILFLLIFLFFLYYYRRQLQVRSLEMDNLMLQISNLEQLVSGKEETIEGLTLQVQSAIDETCDMRNKTKALFESKYKQMNDLCVSYFTGQNTLFAKNAIYKQVKQIIDSFRDDSKSLAELEDLLNRSYDNILVRLQAEVPQLRREDYLFFCYLFANFSSRAISLLLNENVNTVYQHRSRWKKRLAEMDIPSKDQFLSFL